MILVGIPAFNEEKHIGDVVRESLKFSDKVIVCDDGSKDLTIHQAEIAGATVIRQRHGGYGAALASLFGAAVESLCDVFVTLDGDGQHDPSAIPELVRPILSGEAEIVVGSRFLSQGDSTSAVRKVGIRAITKLTGSQISDAQSGFRAYNRLAIRLVAPSEMGMSASTEILARASESSMRIMEVPISVTYGPDSHTHGAFYHGLDVVTGTFKQAAIRHPLMLFGIPGFLCLVASSGFLAWALYLWPIKGYVVANLALAAGAFGVCGLVLSIAGVMIWLLVSVIRDASHV